MAICPFMNEECTIGNEEKNCVFEITPYSEKKPVATVHCALRAAAVIYITQYITKKEQIQQAADAFRDEFKDLFKIFEK
jgi:hypothetical protein